MIFLIIEQPNKRQLYKNPIQLRIQQKTRAFFRYTFRLHIKCQSKTVTQSQSKSCYKNQSVFLNQPLLKSSIQIGWLADSWFYCFLVSHNRSETCFSTSCQVQDMTSSNPPPVQCESNINLADMVNATYQNKNYHRHVI